MRNNTFQKVASFAKLLVLSGRDAEKDFRNLYPDSKAVIRTLSFHTMMPDELFSGNPVEIQHKYGLPDKFLICSNQFWIHKNHMLVFEAMAKLHSAGRTVHLVCTGPTEDYRFPGYFNQIKQMLTDLKLNDYVHILGIIPRNDQLQLMRRSLAVVQPSLFEGWSTVVEDARALGKILILSDLEVHKEQAPEHAVFFDRHSSNDLLNKISEILPKLKPGPDSLREQQARTEAKELVKQYARQFCCIAVEAQYLFGRSISGHGKQAQTISDRDKIAERDQTQDLNIQRTTEINRIYQLIESGNFEKALSALEQAIEKYPDTPDFVNLQAVLKLRTGDNEGAKSILFDLIQRWPTHYPAYNNLALIFWNSGDIENAMKYFEDALRIGQFDRAVVISYGNMLMGTKKFAKAKEIFDGYLLINPDDSETRSLLQECEKVLGKVTKLMQIVEKFAPLSHP